VSDRACYPKKKMVPSDPISQPNSPPACNGTELCNQDCRASSRQLPAAFFRTQRINAFRLTCQLFLAGTGISKRPFTLPKRLPVSRPPFRGQSSRPAPSTPCRSFVLLVRIPIPPRAPVRPGTRKLTTEIPLPDSRPALPTLPRIPTPLRGLSDP
jgi:hypothetical protein